MGPLPARVVALVVLVALGAGCLGGAPDARSTASPSPTGPATPTPGGHEHAANRPDPDRAVHLSNGWNRSVTMRVRAVREATNATVHDATHELAPGTERVAYNTAAADPDGIESFAVVVTARNATERVAIETSECYGGAHGQVRPDGSLYVFDAIR